MSETNHDEQVLLRVQQAPSDAVRSSSPSEQNIVRNTQSRSSLTMRTNLILSLVEDSSDEEEDSEMMMKLEKYGDDKEKDPALTSVSHEEVQPVQLADEVDEKDHEPDPTQPATTSNKRATVATTKQEGSGRTDSSRKTTRPTATTTTTGGQTTKSRTSSSSSSLPLPPLHRSARLETGTDHSTVSDTEGRSVPSSTTRPGAYFHMSSSRSLDIEQGLLAVDDDDDNEYDDEGVLVVKAVAKVVDDDYYEATTADARSAFERSIREQIMLEAVQADAVVEAFPYGSTETNGRHGDDKHQTKHDDVREESSTDNQGRQRILICVVVSGLVLLILVVIGRAVNNGQSSSSSSPTISTRPTLELVKERDYLICGSFLEEGTTEPEKDGLQGLMAELCRAVAAVALDDPNKVRYTAVGPWDRFVMLQNRSVDLLTEPATHTMGRDVWETATGSGLSFSTPFYYSGLGFAGNQTYVDCLDKFDVSTGICRSVIVCAVEGTTHLDILRQFVPGAHAIPKKSADECIRDVFVPGDCNAVAGEPISLTEEKFRANGYNGPVASTQNVLSREPLALVTRDVEPEWSDIVNSVMDILFSAEGYNLTQESVQRAAETGDETYLPALFRNVNNDSSDDVIRTRMLKVVAAVGNYGEIYDRTMTASLSRDGLNDLNRDGATTGLLYSFPFGYELDKLDTLKKAGDKVAALRGSKRLRCGVMEQPGFAELNQTTWVGLDVEFCKALASALFPSSQDGTLDIINFGGHDDINASQIGFEMLLNDTVDVVAGLGITLANKYHEPFTGQSYSFSPPYFYGPNDDYMVGLVTARNDPNWSDFVYWVVMGVINAEENGITSTNSTKMPIVNVFGDELKQLFVDCVSRVGNYGDIYERTLTRSTQLPRLGRNQLNDLQAGLGPQQVALPVA